MLKFIKPKHSKRVVSSRTSTDTVGVFDEKKNMYSEILLGLIKYAKKHYERVYNKPIVRVHCIENMFEYDICDEENFENYKKSLLFYLAEVTALNRTELIQKQKEIYQHYRTSAFFPNQYTDSDERRIKNDESEILLSLIKYTEDNYPKAFDYEQFQLKCVEIILLYDSMNNRMYNQYKNALLYYIAYSTGARNDQQLKQTIKTPCVTQHYYHF